MEGVICLLSKITFVKRDFHPNIMAVTEIIKKKINTTEASFLCSKRKFCSNDLDIFIKNKKASLLLITMTPFFAENIF